MKIKSKYLSKSKLRTLISLRVLFLAVIYLVIWPSISFSDNEALAPPTQFDSNFKAVQGLKIQLQMPLGKIDEKTFFPLLRDHRNYSIMSKMMTDLFPSKTRRRWRTLPSLEENAYDALIDKIENWGDRLKDFKIRVVLELYEDGEDIVFRITDNGKSIEFCENGEIKVNKKLSLGYFGLLHEDVERIKKSAKEYGYSAEWYPLKEGTMVELRTKKEGKNIPLKDAETFIIKDYETEKAWDEETLRSIREGEIRGKAFRNRTAFRDISTLIGLYLKHGISEHTLISDIKRHIDAAELAISETAYDPLLAGFKFEKISFNEDEDAYYLPVYRGGKVGFYYKYYTKGNPQDAHMNIPLPDGGNVYVKVERIKKDYYKNYLNKTADPAAQIIPFADDMDCFSEPVEIIVEESANKEEGIPYIVGIGGCNAVGKSTYFAPGLQKMLESKDKKTFILDMDIFAKSPNERALLDSEWGPDHVRLDEIRDVMSRVKNGEKKIKVLAYDRKAWKKKKELVEREINLEGIDIIIFEGLYVINNEKRVGNLVEFIDFPIYIDADLEDIRKWKINQEAEKGTRTLDEVEHHWKEGNLPDSINNIIPSRDNARFTVFVSGNHEIEYFGFSKNNKGKPEELSTKAEEKYAHMFKDIIKIIDRENNGEPFMFALGTSWIKGYVKDRYIQYDAINPLMSEVREYCKERDICFIDKQDKDLLGQIEEEKKKKHYSKIIVLAKKDTVFSDSFREFKSKENVFFAGVDDKEITKDSYIRLMEIMTLTLKLAFDKEGLIDRKKTNILFKRDDIDPEIYIFTPNAEPMDYEKFQEICNAWVSA